MSASTAGLDEKFENLKSAIVSAPREDQPAPAATANLVTTRHLAQ